MKTEPIMTMYMKVDLKKKNFNTHRTVKVNEIS